MPRRTLLTGASGFVGSHLLRRLLLTTDDEIVCLVTYTHQGLPDRIRLVLEECFHHSSYARTHILRHDLTAPITPVLDKAIGPIDRVFNVASESHVDRSITDPADFILNNVALICRVLDWQRNRRACVEQVVVKDAAGRVVTTADVPGQAGFAPAGVIVQVSTDEVYGPAPEGTAHAEWNDLHLPSNPYAASKAAQEDIAFSYWRTYDLPIVITNTMNIIGQMQHPEKFVPMVVAKVLNGEKVIIHGSASGDPGSRFYLHADNQAAGLLHVADWVTGAYSQWDKMFGADGEQLPDYWVSHNPNPEHDTMLLDHHESLRYSEGGSKPFRFHIVGEMEVDNLTMAQWIADIVGKPLLYEVTDFHSSRPGHDLRYALDGAKMAAIGWKPPVPLKKSLEAAVEWTLEHREWLDL